ncbi:MAG: carboxylesterase family protein, partial [Clostridiales bacterium]|nr:carboxylesterase family protein [Clostridiales bacterium]
MQPIWIVLFSVLGTIAAEAVLLAVTVYVYYRGMPRRYAAKNRKTFVHNNTEPEALRAAYADKSDKISDLVYPSAYPNNTFDVFLPKAREGKSYPVMIWLHGGGWFAGDKAGGDNILTVAAARGYVGITMNYA